MSRTLIKNLFNKNLPFVDSASSNLKLKVADDVLKEGN